MSIFSSTELIYLFLAILAGVAIFFFIELKLSEKRLKTLIEEAKSLSSSHNNNGNSMLRLQAYERLTLLTDRISLKNIVPRLHTSALSAAELQSGLVTSIRAEYEHNITQQNYVAPEIWKAISNLKEQNIYIINELNATLPPQATALDLSKLVLQYTNTNNAELSNIVMEAIQFEVNKLV